MRDYPCSLDRKEPLLLKRAFFLCAVPFSLTLGTLLLFPCPSPADNQPALSLPEVLTRYLQATASVPGHDAVTTRRFAGTTSYGGLHGTYVTIDKLPGKHWEEDKLGIFDDLSGSDGKVSWHRDTNGNIRLESLEEQKDDRTDTVLDTRAFAHDAFPGKVTLRPQAERKTGCYVLDITPTDGKPVTLYLDPRTFLTVKEERLDDNRLSTTTYSDYKMMGGRLRPGTRRIRSGSRKSDSVITTDAVEDNVDAPDTLFTLPATVNNYAWVTPGATSASLPFDYSDKSIALYCAVNGRPTFLELDSGASGVAISKVAADDLKLARQGTFEAQGYGGFADTSSIKLDSFELVGGVVFSNLSAASLPLFERYAAYQAVPTIGLLGYDLLSRFVVRINYETQMLTLIDPKTFQPAPADGTPLVLDLNDNTPSVLASFDGLPPARFLVDTGDAVSTVMLYGPYVSDNHIAQKYPRGIGGGGEGVGGRFKVRDVRAHAFAIGGLALGDVPTQLSLDTKGAGASRVLAGALGTDFLSHFIVTFDYAHSRVFFAPNADTHKPFDTRTFGIYAYGIFDESLRQSRIVLFADPKAPAQNAGLMNGATLLKIDGQDAVKLGIGEVRRLLSAAGGKDTHDLFIIGDSGGTGHVKVAMFDPLPPLNAK